MSLHQAHLQRRALSGVQVLRIEPQHRAATLGRPARRSQSGDVVPDIEIGRHAARSPRSMEQPARRRPGPPAQRACAIRPASRRYLPAGRSVVRCADRGTRRTFHGRRGCDLVVEAAQRFRIVADDGGDGVARLMQGVGFLQHAWIGREVARTHDADGAGASSCPVPHTTRLGQKASEE